MNGLRNADALAAWRRLEELALNASGAFQSLVYDGWLIGYRKGPTKRLRCVNPFYASSLALAEKLDYCIRFYEAAKLPAIFRLLPFSQPPELDAFLDRLGWGSFERTLVLRATLVELLTPAQPDGSVAILPPPEWEASVAPLLNLTGDGLLQSIERAKGYPLPYTGAVIRRDGEVVACGLIKFEGDHAGLFAVTTAPKARGEGLGRAIVTALLDEARRRKVRVAYLQVTEHNHAAMSLYRSFGFATAYDYWYRARRDEQH